MSCVTEERFSTISLWSAEKRMAVEYCEKDDCGVWRKGWLWSVERKWLWIAERIMAAECGEKMVVEC